MSLLRVIKLWNLLLGTVEKLEYLCPIHHSSGIVAWVVQVFSSLFALFLFYFILNILRCSCLFCPPWIWNHKMRIWEFIFIFFNPWTFTVQSFAWNFPYVISREASVCLIYILSCSVSFNQNHFIIIHKITLNFPQDFVFLFFECPDVLCGITQHYFIHLLYKFILT